MNLPSFPTDNLYKFIALSGIFIIFGSEYLLFVSLHQYQIKIFETEEQSGIAQIEVDALSDKLAVLESEIAEWEKTKDENTRGIYINKLRQIQDEKKQLEIFQAKIHKEIEITGVLRFEYKLARITLNFGMIVGTIMMIIGFYFWYTKVQYFQDKELTNKK